MNIIVELVNCTIDLIKLMTFTVCVLGAVEYAHATNPDGRATVLTGKTIPKNLLNLLENQNGGRLSLPLNLPKLNLPKRSPISIQGTPKTDFSAVHELLAEIIQYDNQELFESILNAQSFFDMSSQDKDGNTLLHKALLSNAPRIAYELLGKNISLNIKNNKELSVIDLWNKKGLPIFLNKLIKYTLENKVGASKTKKTLKASKKRKPLPKLPTKKVPWVQISMAAVKQKIPKLNKFYAENTFDLDKILGRTMRTTYLHESLKNNKYKTVIWLLEKRAQVSVKNKEGISCWQIFIEMCKKGIFDLQLNLPKPSQSASSAKPSDNPFDFYSKSITTQLAQEQKLIRLMMSRGKDPILRA